MTTVQGFVYLTKAYAWDSQDAGAPAGLTPTWVTYDPTGHNGVLLVIPTALTFDMPEDFDPRAHQIAALRENRKKANAAFVAMVADIDRQINELQALEFTP